MDILQEQFKKYGHHAKVLQDRCLSCNILFIDRYPARSYKYLIRIWYDPGHGFNAKKSKLSQTSGEYVNLCKTFASVIERKYALYKRRNYIILSF